MTRPQDRPRSGPLSADALSWLVRQACGEKVKSCRRKQDSHAREVHEVVTASGGRLVLRGEARDLAGLRALLAGKLRNSVFPELPQVTCGLIVDELCKSRWITIVTCG